MSKIQDKPKAKATSEQKGYREPKGMKDVLPAERHYWNRIEKAVRDLAEFYNFSNIATPVMEYAKLFEKGTGEETDIVEKEMYIVKTKGGDTLSLRPEFTPSIARSYMEYGLSRLGQPQKLFAYGPVFRHDNPQLGRYRQFTQADYEVIGGANDSLYDAQIIVIAVRLLEDLKINETVLRINSIGCRVCRPTYKKNLQNYYKNFEKQICSDCQRRHKTNPLKLLDCKKPQCQEFKEKAPNVLDKLCQACTQHFKGVLEYLDEAGISYRLDNQLVRGLDYYSRTVFEIHAEGKAAEIGSLAAGGRYDYLMEMIGGRPTPAVGFASSFERLIDVAKLQQIAYPAKPVKRVFIAHAGELAKKKAFKIIEELRSHNILISESLARESLKAQLKVADKEKAPVAVIIGQKEIFEDSVIVRDLRSGLQETYPTARMVEEIRKRLRAVE